MHSAFSRLLLALLIWAAPILSAQAAITFVGHAEGTLAGTGTTAVTSAARTVTAGNLLVVSVAWEGGGDNDPATVSALTDTAGNTYVFIGDIATSTSGTAEDNHIFLFYAENCLGATNNVVSATPSLSRGPPRIVTVTEYSYSGGIDVIDFKVSENGSSVSSANVASMTAAAGDLLVGAIKWTSSSQDFTADAGYAGRTGLTDSEYFDQVVGAGGGFTPGGTFDSPESYALIAAQFREVAGGGSSGLLRRRRGN